MTAALRKNCESVKTLVMNGLCRISGRVLSNLKNGMELEGTRDETREEKADLPWFIMCMRRDHILKMVHA
jgi:hypothetical protein